MMQPLGTGDFDAIIDLIREKQSFLMLLHVNPDGDSLGSTIGLGLALEQAGKKVTMVLADPIPDVYRFLPGIDRMVHYTQVHDRHDAVFFLDCGDLERTGPAASVIALADLKVNIDHHISNTLYGDLNYIDSRCAAVGEQVYRMLHVLDYPLNEDIATALYTSIVTDTGSFKFENTTVDTHLIASHLLTYDVKPQLVSQAIYDSKTLPGLRLLELALKTLELNSTGEIASISVTREMMSISGAKDEETEGLINFPRSLKGVELALMFKESADGSLRISLRSKKYVNASRLAGLWDGGGHARAAGCTVSGNLPDVKKALMAAGEKAILDEAPSGER